MMYSEQRRNRRAVKANKYTEQGKQADGSTSRSQNSERKRMDGGTHRAGKRDLYLTSTHIRPWPDISNKAMRLERDGHFERQATRSIGLLACGGGRRQCEQYRAREDQYATHASA